MSLAISRHILRKWNAVFGLAFVAIAFILAEYAVTVDPFATVVGVVYTVVNIQLLGFSVSIALGEKTSRYNLLLSLTTKVILFVGLVIFLSSISSGAFWSALFGVFTFVPASYFAVIEENRR